MLIKLSLHTGETLLGVERSQALGSIASQPPAQPLTMPNSSHSGSEVWWSRRRPCLQPWWPCFSPTLIPSTSSIEASFTRWNRGWHSGNDAVHLWVYLLDSLHTMAPIPWTSTAHTSGTLGWGLYEQSLSPELCWVLPTLDTITSLRKFLPLKQIRTTMISFRCISKPHWGR